MRLSNFWLEATLSLCSPQLHMATKYRRCQLTCPLARLNAVRQHHWEPPLMKCWQ
jgi:hypothetical protein